MAVYLGPLVDSIDVNSCAILWITPLRALAADTLRALREPQQFYNPKLTAEARTGDTTLPLDLEDEITAIFRDAATNHTTGETHYIEPDEGDTDK
jgi:hypothetical protein